MTEGAADLEMPVCSRCGNSHLPPRWDREYLCPACGAPLRSRETRGAGLRWRPWLAVGMGALLLAGGAARIVLDRRSVPAATATRSTTLRGTVPPSVPPEQPLPRGLESRVQERIRLLREDLARAPQNTALLTRLAECELILAVLYRDRRTASQAEKHRESAERYLERLQSITPLAALPLSNQLKSFALLTWGPPRVASAAESRTRRSRFGEQSGGSLGGPVPTPGASGANFLREPAGQQPVSPPPPGMEHVSPPIPIPDAAYMSPPEGERPGPRDANPFPPRPLAPPPMQHPGAPVEALTPALDVRPARSSHTHSQRDKLLAEVTQVARVVRTDPDNVFAALHLGDLYERLAEDAGPGRPFARTEVTAEERRWLQKALEVYQRAAKEVPLRTHQAMFLDLSAEMYGRLRDWEKQYDTLRRAVKVVPTSPTLWSKLQRACLLSGKREEYRRARQAARDWSFPTLELRQNESAFVAPQPWR